jgi:arylsulfatase A-like enzyme
MRLLLLTLAVLTVPGAFARSAGGADSGGRPNVLFIAADDLNHWVHHLGRNPQAKTPHIDRLADRGVTFTNAYCAVPACNPSRAALMSGLRPWNTACYTNGDFWTKHIPEGVGLSAQFLKAGYYVAGAGKIYHNDSYYESEWSEYMSKEGFSAHGAGVNKDEGFHEPLRHDLQDEDLGDWQTVNWCIERLNRQQEKPFFLACGLHKPHLPFAVPRKYYDMFPLDQIELPPYREDDLDDIPPAGVRMARPEGDHARFLQSGRWKAAIQSYLATVAYTDMNIGRLLDALDKSPCRDNTIIVLWGDHGWHFGEKHHWRKFALWEEATRAPLIWVAPGVTKAGGVCSRPVDFMTIYPTLCELAGLPVPKHVEGTSIESLLRDPQAAWSQPAITTHGYKNHAVRTEKWRYIQYADGSEELYDHEHDPYEWTNLANDRQSADVIREHAQWLPKTNAVPVKGSTGGQGKKAKTKLGKQINLP